MGLENKISPAPALETPRLLLQPLALADAEAYHRGIADWEIIRLISSAPWPYTPADAQRFIERQLARGPEARDWTLRLKSAPDEIIGALTMSVIHPPSPWRKSSEVGGASPEQKSPPSAKTGSGGMFAPGNVNSRPSGQLAGPHNEPPGTWHRGFWLVRRLHRQGLMTEAVTAVNDYMFGTLGIARIFTRNTIGNLASRRVKEKTGSRFLRVEVSHDERSDAVRKELWELTAEDWQAWKK